MSNIVNEKALRGGAELRRFVERQEAVLLWRARTAGLSRAEIALELGGEQAGSPSQVRRVTILTRLM